jgi:hypothetical protein
MVTSMLHTLVTRSKRLQRREDTGGPERPPVAPNLKSKTSRIAHGHLVRRRVVRGRGPHGRDYAVRVVLPAGGV